MPEHIGKYRIVEPIGRGGMGMIFKAHDPILDRLVALKVISPEVEITDELRARFFREAKACAKLNHPNIVTVHDMGEDAGRLFIVMELLEGQELRRLIKADTSLTLEDKLSVMLQVCRGLHYAHQNGIVHRDMKPGNIFMLRSGQVKILDFGIAQIATTEADLTRTGLIMGTLRYISPEQVRGRADHRSDMFSVASVFYELLTLRPPFLGEDPMQLLEQLRTEEPPPPTQIDPTIPPELAAVVQRAMRKDPDDRFHDLEEMRSALEVVHEGLIEERQSALARVRRQRERIVQLQTALAERVGATGEDEPIRAIAERHGLVAMREAEREFAGRIETMEAKVARADALAPAVKRAHALLDAGRFEDAAIQFERIVADMPDHQRAREGLSRARAEADAHSQRQLAADLFQKARSALDERRYALCLEILKQAAEISLPEGTGAQVASLRETALARQEASRQARQEADEAHEQMSQERSDAQTEGAAEYAPGPWNEAEAMAAAAEAGLRGEAYAEAKRGFDRAAAAYRRSLEAARQAQGADHQASVRAREMATQDQNQARATGASEYARDLWDAAETRFAEARAAFAAKASGRAGAAFTEASALYRRAKDAAGQAGEREHRRADAARSRAAEGRRSAATMEAERHAPAVWQQAVDKSTQGEAAFLRRQYAKATEAFEAALAIYHQAQAQVGELPRRQREEARTQQQEMAERRRGAMAVEAAALATSDWNEAEASAAAGEEAFARKAWQDALGAFAQAASLYRLAEERARETLRTRLDAEKAVEAAEQARRAATEANATRYAPEPWKDAQRVEARAVAAFSQQQFAAARTLFDEAARLYTVATQSAGIAAEADVRSKPAPPLTETPPTQAEQTLLQAEVVARRPPATFDDAATVLIRPPETVKPPTVIAGRDDAIVLDSAPTPVRATHVPPAEPDVGEQEPRRARGTAPDMAQATPGRFGRLRARTVAVAIGTLAVILVAVVYWWSQPSPPSPPVAVSPPQPPSAPTAASPVARPDAPSADREAAERLQSQVMAARDEATKAGAERLSATEYAAGEEKSRAGEAALSQRDMATAQERYREALEAYGRAKTEADRAGLQARAPPSPPSVQKPDRVVATTPRPAPPNPATVKPPSSPPSGAQQPEPLTIRKAVEQKLRAAGLLRNPDSDEPGVTVEDVGADGTVRLVGVLRDAAARQAVADLVRTIAGVTAVDVRRVTVQKGWASQ